MKTLYNILVASFMLIMLACTPTTKDTEDKPVVSNPPAPAPLTLAQKREANEKIRIAQEEKRKTEWEQLVKEKPYYTDENNVVIFNKVEESPSYTGGEEAMRNYLRDNLKYPEEARRNELEGTLFVDFIIAANGSVRSVEVSEMPGEQIDESLRKEAIRVINNMPKWVPGRQGGKWVDVKYSLPITFKMG